MNPDGYESTYAYQARLQAAIQEWITQRIDNMASNPEFRAWCRMIALKRGSRR